MKLVFPRPSPRSPFDRLRVALVRCVPVVLLSCGTPPSLVKTPPMRASAHHDPKPVGEPLPPMAYHRSGFSYDEALAIAEDLGATKDAPELTDAELATPMANGDSISACGAPDTMKVVVKVAVRQGTAMGVSVATSPEDPEVAACVDKAVRALSWPASAKRFTFTTAY